ncbi:hypothetical protein HanRHA438_Chr13g0605461 [Helianthus annuus]|nr:hypothetical protein HanIR_Chr13g0647141 [Helianthus annuus]KAJ0858818.1 hypothetical protein HanRHA438_Chr13g0605461 [Helianthus annuus]
MKLIKILHKNTSFQLSYSNLVEHIHTNHTRKNTKTLYNLHTFLAWQIRRR